MSEPTEDLPYSVGPAAQPIDNTRDVDNDNIPLLRRVLKEVDEEIAKYNSLDAIDTFRGPMTLEQKAACYDQMDNNKKFVALLRQHREQIADKIKELRNGQ